MDLKLVIAKQRAGEKLVIDINEAGLKGLIALAEAAGQLGMDTAINGIIPATLIRNGNFERIHKSAILTSEEYEQAIEGATEVNLEAKAFIDSKRGSLMLVTFKRGNAIGGSRERDDMTVGLRMADLTMLLSRALSRIDIANRELRLAEKGARDGRLGRKGKEARQRVGKIKQEMHNAKQKGDVDQEQSSDAGESNA